MTDPLTLPELCRASLAKLHADFKAAERLYLTAAGSAVAALGLDPKDDIKLDLDTGIITPAAPKAQ